MKILGKILIIVVVTAIIAGAMVMAVNASGTSAGGFPADGGGFRPQAGLTGDAVEGFQPGQRPEGFGRERGGGGLGGWLGVVKNIAIISALVAVVVIPRKLLARRKVDNRFQPVDGVGEQNEKAGS